MISNKHSYRYEVITSENGLFNNYIDVAYIITMENSTRRNDYMEQINKYNPHSKIVIQHNKGFKKCTKQLYKQNTIHDLNDAYYHAFLHAKSNNYNNVLIFEDDFFFDNVKKEDVHEIGMFIKNNNYHIYNLGPIINIGINKTLYHKQNIIMTSAHGVIYNTIYFDYYIKNYNKLRSDEPNDQLWNDISLIKYSYYKPICFQLFPITENCKNWSSYWYASYLIKITKLDKSHKSYYKLTSFFTFTSYLIILFVLYYILYTNK